MPSSNQSDPKLTATTAPTLPLLRRGDTGEVVRILQRLLLFHGYPISVNGVFGAGTDAAVKSFQRDRSLLKDGIVGTKTWWALSLDPS